MILSAQTTPSWSWDVVSSIATAAAALVAVAALVLSIVNYVQARETRVSWRVEREVSKNGVAYEVRLINESRRFAAVVQSVGDPVPVSEEDGGPLVDPQGIAFPQ